MTTLIWNELAGDAKPFWSRSIDYWTLRLHLRLVPDTDTVYQDGPYDTRNGDSAPNYESSNVRILGVHGNFLFFDKLSQRRFGERKNPGCEVIATEVFLIALDAIDATFAVL